MIKILMHGCNGRMGQMISGLVRDEEEMMIAAGVDTYQGVSNEYPVFGSIDACDDDVDVVIDFSNAAAADAVMEYCAKRQSPLVFVLFRGTPGEWSDHYGKTRFSDRAGQLWHRRRAGCRCLWPVSYTHLDVYKRQLFARKTAGIPAARGLEGESGAVKIGRASCRERV